MSMSAGGSDKGLTNEPNVTPMIDVLLVLLIIFMMIIPMSRKAIDVQFPDPTPHEGADEHEARPDRARGAPGSDVPDQQGAGGQGRPVRADCKEIYDPRPEKIMFFKGDPGRHVSGRDLRDGPGARSRREGHRRSAEAGDAPGK